MGPHEEISEATRGDFLDCWIVSRNVGRTAEKFGLPTKEVKRVIHDAAVVSRLPESVKADIHGEVRRLQMMMDRYWPDAMAGDKKAAELWRKLGVDLRLLTGWQAPASSGFRMSVNVAQVTSGSAKLEELLNRISALPPLSQSEVGNEVGKEGDDSK
jgi:hypothetical protein